jgi:hypothetical protein
MTATPASTARVRPANSPSRLMGDGPRLRGGVVSRSDAWVVAFPGTRWRLYLPHSLPVSQASNRGPPSLSEIAATTTTFPGPVRERLECL